LILINEEMTICATTVWAYRSDTRKISFFLAMESWSRLMQGAKETFESEAAMISSTRAALVRQIT